jgi:hypothetical protein
MESISAAKQEDMVNVQLTPSTVNLDNKQTPPAASSCAC